MYYVDVKFKLSFNVTGSLYLLPDCQQIITCSHVSSRHLIIQILFQTISVSLTFKVAVEHLIEREFKVENVPFLEGDHSSRKEFAFLIHESFFKAGYS